MKHKITTKLIDNFKTHLIENEKSGATIEKYTRDINAFFAWLHCENIDKSTVLEYKRHIKEKYKTRSVNSMISSINCFFEFMNWYDCKIKTIKVQRESFYDENKELSKKELSKTEYDRLLKTASKDGNERLSLIMQTICSCGLRISEDIYCKG